MITSVVLANTSIMLHNYHIFLWWEHLRSSLLFSLFSVRYNFPCQLFSDVWYLSKWDFLPCFLSSKFLKDLYMGSTNKIHSLPPKVSSLMCETENKQVVTIRSDRVEDKDVHRCLWKPIEGLSKPAFLEWLVREGFLEEVSPKMIPKKQRVVDTYIGKREGTVSWSSELRRKNSCSWDAISSGNEDWF